MEGLHDFYFDANKVNFCIFRKCILRGNGITKSICFKQISTITTLYFFCQLKLCFFMSHKVVNFSFGR